MMLSRMDRRSFSRLLVLGAGSGMLPSLGEASSKNELSLVELPKWRPGMFQIHFIYTGVAESMFLMRESWRGAHVVVSVEPDGTRYTVARASASDEKMKVLDVREFNKA